MQGRAKGRGVGVCCGLVVGCVCSSVDPNEKRRDAVTVGIAASLCCPTPLLAAAALFVFILVLDPPIQQQIESIEPIESIDID